MGGSSRQTLGYDYLIGIHMGVCRGPVNALVEIRVADRTAWEGSVTDNQTVQINARELFGGDSAEGGVEGSLDVMMGGSSQAVNSQLHGMLGGLVPAFRGVMTLFFDGLVSSLNPYPKPWSLRVRRTTAGWESDNPWYPEAALIELAGGDIHAMNPIHIIYQALTDPDWGLGNSRQMIGSSFDAAADTLLAENFGLCLRWNRQASVQDFTQEMVEHVGASVFLDHFTGRWEIALVRDDYDPEELPLFDYDSGLVAIDEDGASAPAEAVNEIIVTYRDPLTNEDRQVRVQNLAGIQSAGAVRSQTLSYTGIPTAELAYRIAQRELRARSTGVKRFKLRMDRRGYQLQPGSVFRISVPSRGIENMVLRVGQVRNSELRQGPIEIDAAQDVFGLPATSYVTAQPPGYVPPKITPEPIETLRIVELTYRDALDAEGIRTIAENDTGAWVAALALRSNPLDRNFLLQTQPDGADEWTTGVDGDYCPTAELVEDMPIGEASVTVDLTGAVDLDLVETGTAALIDDEIFRVDALDAEGLTATLARGCIDTVPAAHDAGARVWFYGGGYAGVDTVEYEASETVSARLRSRTSIATLPVDDATGGDITLSGRPGRPYPPGRVRINGDAYPEAAEGVLRVSWSTRDKEVIDDQLVDAAMTSAGTPDVTYRVTLRRADTEEVLASETGLENTAVDLFASYTGDVVLSVAARTVSYDPDTECWQPVEIPFNYIAAGYGRGYGFAYGGTRDPGVIAPRGGIASRTLDIEVGGYLEGLFVGIWDDSDVSGEVWVVSSSDGEQWIRHGIAPVNYGASVYRLDGQWVIFRNGALYMAADLGGPWDYKPHGFGGSLPFSGVLDGELLLWGDRIVGTADGDAFTEHSLPPVVDPERTGMTVFSITHGASGYVALVEEGSASLGDIEATEYRVWRSDDLSSWSLVTPQFLVDGEFGTGENEGRWTGNRLQHFDGVYLLPALLAPPERRRVMFRSSDGETWTECTFDSDPGREYGIVEMAKRDGTIYALGRSIAWETYGLPRVFTSSNGSTWQVATFDPLSEYFPVRPSRLVAGPDRLLVNDNDPDRVGTGPQVQGQLVSATDGTTWTPLRLQRPTEEE